MQVFYCEKGNEKQEKQHMYPCDLCSFLNKISARDERVSGSRNKFNEVKLIYEGEAVWDSSSFQIHVKILLQSD